MTISNCVNGLNQIFADNCRGLNNDRISIASDLIFIVCGITSFEIVEIPFCSDGYVSIIILKNECYFCIDADSNGNFEVFPFEDDEISENPLENPKKYFNAE